MIPQNCVVIDAATASEDGQIKGDLADDVYEREDLTLTPKKGGIGPLTVCALFDNVIRASGSNLKTNE
jgi:methylenetetrahydrofolate dehydrogenase (NADP+)/methenyltetrahydrofolate cyclohydrolase